MNAIFIFLLSTGYFLFINLTYFFFYKKEMNRKLIYLTTFFSIFNIFIYKYFFNIYFINILLVITFHLLYCKIFLKIKLIYNLLFLITSMLITLLISNLITYIIFIIPFMKGFFDKYIEIIYFIAEIISMFTIDYILYIFIKNNILNFIFNNLSNKYIKLFLAIAFIIILPQFINITFEKFEFKLTYIMLSFVQLLFIYFFVFQFIYTNIKKQKLYEENNILNNELSKLTLINDETRLFKHDFNNIVGSINGYIILKKYDELEVYIKKILQKCGYINSISSVNAEVFNHPAIYGILIGKTLSAINKQIKFNIQSSIDYYNINFDINDLSRVIGILIDNAFEASLKSNTTPYVSYEAYYSNIYNCTIIKISNNFDNTIKIDLTKIFDKGYSNKKIKSGLGLWEVKKLISKSNNSTINTTIKDNLFTQIISIPNEIYI